MPDWRSVVWTAVFAIAAGVGAVVGAAIGLPSDVAIGTAILGLTLATLSTRQ